jgi:hypothetical protein
MIDLDNLYEGFVEFLNSYSEEDFDEWLKFDEMRMKKFEETGEWLDI